jgi:hypothetical protein
MSNFNRFGMGNFSGMRANFANDTSGNSSTRSTRMGGDNERSFRARFAEMRESGGVNPEQFSQFSGRAMGMNPQAMMAKLGGGQQNGMPQGMNLQAMMEKFGSGQQGGMPEGMNPQALTGKLDGLTKNSNGGIDFATFKAEIGKNAPAGAPTLPDEIAKKMFSQLSGGSTTEISATRLNDLKTKSPTDLMNEAKDTAFAKMDTTGNGSIDKNEFIAGAKAKLTEIQAAVSASGQTSSTLPSSPTDEQLGQLFDKIIASTGSTTGDLTKDALLSVKPENMNDRSNAFNRDTSNNRQFHVGRDMPFGRGGFGGGNFGGGMV